MEQVDRLDREILTKLSKIGSTLQEGDSRPVQPHIEGQHVENPLMVPGLDHDQIDRRLRLLLQRGLIYTHVKGDPPLIGIYFSGLTDAGRRALQAPH